MSNPAATHGWAHNLGTVIAFEFTRTLRRRSFWITTLAVPALIVALSSLIVFSNNQAAEGTGGRDQSVTFTYADASSLVDPAVAKAAGGTPASDAAAAREDVVQGRSDLFISFPADPASQPIEVAGRDEGLTGTPDYGAIARKVLSDSVRAKIADARVTAVLSGATSVNQVTYADGQVAPGFAAAILPGLFIVVFYMAIMLLGNQMLNITVEEKENRVTEMILTTIHPTTLIVGKLIALVGVGLVQAAVLIGPTLLISPGILAAVSPSASVSVNVPGIALAAVLFLGGFLMFSGLLVSVGAIMPTAKEAGSAFGAVVITIFLPLYAIGILLADPHGVVSQALTFFPLTAPITAMARNATGTLLPWEAALSIVVIYATAVALLALGIRLFRTGSISYDARLDVRKVLSSRHGQG